MRAYGAGLICLVVAMLSSASAVLDFTETAVSSICRSMQITDQVQVNKFLEHVKTKRLNTDSPMVFSYNLVCPEGGNQEVYIRDAVEMTSAFPTSDRDYVMGFMRLVQDLPNKAEIIKKAHDFADMYWWSDFVQIPIGIFDRSKVIGSLVEHYRYRYTWHAFKDWYRERPNNEDSFICREEAIMAFLKYEAERHTPFDTLASLHEAFEVVCTDTSSNWNEVLQHDDLKSAEEHIVLTYLKEGTRLHAAWRRQSVKNWTLKVLARHVAQCRDEKCVEWLIKVVYEDVLFHYNLTPSCMDRIMRESVKKAVDWTNVMNFLLFFLRDIEPKIKECDQSFVDFIMEAYDIQKNKLSWVVPERFSYKILDPMITGVMARYKKNQTWTSVEANMLLAALREADLSAVNLSRFFSMDLSVDINWQLALLRVYLATGKNKEYFLNMSTRQDNFKEIVDLGTTKTAKTDLALSVYLTDREKTVCKPETMKAIVDLDAGVFTELMYERMIRDVCGNGKEHEEKARKIIEDGTKSRTMIFKIRDQLDELKKQTLAPAAANAK